jgi:hypothetical protein
MFVTPKDFNVAADLIDEELERDPEARRKQRAFRERVLGDYVSASTFRTPAELAGLVRQAVHNFERERASKVERERVSKEERERGSEGGRARSPNVGPLVPQTCDRVDQEADFGRAFGRGLKQRPGFPQFYVVHGEERESHTSFVERLRLTTIQRYAALQWGEQQAAVPLWDLDWPDPDRPASRREQLKSFVFERIDPNYVLKGGDYSADDLRRLLAALGEYPLVVVHHRVPARAWGADDAALVGWYMEFWDEVKGGADIPQLVVFLSVVYPKAPPDGLWSYVRRARHQAEKRRVREQLLAVCAAARRGPDEDARCCPAVVLDELRCVKPDDVMKWFTRHSLGADDREREHYCDAIFRLEGGDVSDCRNMRDVESKLGEIHRQLVGRRMQP